ncbi:type II toxin-antitoxin system RelE/ParE family toxin [Halpernia frigidisoli]|uniref:Plasmid stabilization system protein ParE n=1 Tax=Halpernia frigidisoli TaxID=1125876 RepID=A0A1I3FQ90_9FLAO|nr:type II toxin-antitoxin system RelE/ParE family toxin [Halpernia frigidisoli]SFI13262.1 Plasmid stabilization system protein ParE [Halpernia frigidisoli]
MNYQLNISDEAKLDIKDAKKYYADIDKILAKKCITDILNTIDRLAQNPLHHQVRYRNVRIAFAATFPYGIHYIIEKENIFVLRVFHTKRFFK